MEAALRLVFTEEVILLESAVPPLEDAADDNIEGVGLELKGSGEP